MPNLGLTHPARRSAEGSSTVYVARRRVNQAFLEAALEDFHKNGPKAFERCAVEQPGTYLKVFALLMPKEIKLETTNPTGVLTDEQLSIMLAELEARISAWLQGESAKVINAQALPAPAPVQSGAARRQAAYRKRKAAAAGTPGPSDLGA
jgi:hypothetical protein